MPTESGAGPTWTGRFAEELDPGIHAFTTSLSFDRRLARHDLLGSLAHARMLYEREILAGDDARAILEGLAALLASLESGELRVEGDDEDVHSWLERTLRERVGPSALRLHTGRSRNDQTAVALRLWLRDELAAAVGDLLDLVRVWLEQAADHVETWMPGYTHLQRAQPVTLAHHLLAHAWSVLDDAARLRRIHGTAGRSPLGAGALATSTLPLDPERTARLLGLPATFRNSLLAVADRDHVAEAVFAAALAQTHLSRWAEEVVLWTSAEFGFAELSDRVAQGSSLMPQKKNPEAAEIVRGKTGRVIGDVAGLLATLKGLPLAYDSDLQEDKEPLFDALDTVRGSARAAALLAAGLTFDRPRLRSALDRGHVTATDLVDRLVQRGAPFRTAHEQVGRAVREAEERGVALHELPEEALRRHAPGLGDRPFRSLDPGAAVGARDVPGGPAP
ncbi:MAG: argininosuccinate lyase, partial [Gemmatimonadota bacterium]